MAVMIGVDPHKGSHTAVAIGAGEEPLGRLRVRGLAGADLGRGRCSAPSRPAPTATSRSRSSRGSGLLTVALPLRQERQPDLRCRGARHHQRHRNRAIRPRRCTGIGENTRRSGEHPGRRAPLPDHEVCAIGLVARYVASRVPFFDELKVR